MSTARYPQEDYSRPPGSIEIVLVRHGASEAAVEDEPFELLEGQADPALSEAGERQALAVAAHLAGEPLRGLYITPLRRTAQTAAPLAAATGLEPVCVRELREVHLGELDGGAFRIAVRRGDPRVDEVFAKQRWDVIPGAETMAAFAERTRAGIDRILAGLQPGETAAAVVHGGVIGELCRQASGSRPFAFVHADNGSLTRIVVLPDGRRWVRTFNEGAHLRG
ncbi:MAG TPA: histidine phosphatase family protein [Solirubrobacteraceae bacterium]|nr:histidine phosphatase family protein [Solirubrobacteraceae bacterium]